MGELWSEVAELPPAASVTIDDYVQCDAAPMTPAELTKEGILQSVQDEEGSKDSMNNDVTDYEGATAALKNCDESVTTAGMLDIIGRVSQNAPVAKLPTGAMYQKVVGPCTGGKLITLPSVDRNLKQ